MDIRTSEQIARAEEKRQRWETERRALAQTYSVTFGTETGKRVLEDLEREGKYQDPLFALGGSQPVDALRLAALEGRRQLILYIRARITEAVTGPP